MTLAKKEFLEKQTAAMFAKIEVHEKMIAEIKQKIEDMKPSELTLAQNIVKELWIRWQKHVIFQGQNRKVEKLYYSENQEDQDEFKKIQATYHITNEGLNFMKDLNQTRNGKIHLKEITLKEAEKAIEITCLEEEPETKKLCDL